MAIVGIMGLAGNLMSLAVLMRPKLRDASFNQACSDDLTLKKKSAQITVYLVRLTVHPL